MEQILHLPSYQLLCYSRLRFDTLIRNWYFLAILHIVRFPDRAAHVFSYVQYEIYRVVSDESEDLAKYSF